MPGVAKECPFRPGPLETTTVEEDDLTLLDEPPTLGGILTDAPGALTERLLAAFDIKATYNRDKHQVTIHATIRRRPQAALDLLSDPAPTTTGSRYLSRHQPPPPLPLPKIMLPI